MPISRHARITRTAISPRLAIRSFLNLCSIRNRNDKQKQQEDLGVAEVIFKKSGNQEPRQGGKRAQNNPARLGRGRLQHADETGIQFKNKPKERRKTKQAALRRELNDIVFQVAIIGRKITSTII